MGFQTSKLKEKWQTQDKMLGAKTKNLIIIKRRAFSDSLKN
jgi:hypothetical protein